MGFFKNYLTGTRLNSWKRTAFNSLVANNYEKAEEFFRKVYELEGDAQGNAYNLAVSLMGLKRFDEAEPLMLDDAERFGYTLLRCRSLGDLYYLWGKAASAEEWYQKALDESSEAGDEVGEADERMLRKRIEICRDPDAFASSQKGHENFDKGNELSGQGKYDEAIDYFKRAVKLDESNVPAWNNIGSLYFQKKEYEKALKVFNKAARYSNMPALVKNRANVEKAIQDLKNKKESPGFIGSWTKK